MSLQWTIVAGFLYFEIGLVLLLLLPCISPQSWLKIFRSRILHSLGAKTHMYSYGFFGLLCLLFMYAIGEMKKHSNKEYNLNVDPIAEMQAHMKMFRAQRNFYISGFALFFWLIVRRLITLISLQASLICQIEASLNQADAVRRLTIENTNLKATNENRMVEWETEVKNMREENEQLTNDRDAAKSQADSVAKEYDRLADEHNKLQKKLAVTGGDKKND